jgi:hypothetical protein
LCANYLAAGFSFTYSEQVNSNFFHAGRITQIVGKFMQQSGLFRILHELLELPANKGVTRGGIGYLYSGHVRDIPVHSSSVPDR